MEESKQSISNDIDKFSFLNVLVYIAVIAAVTVGLIYALKSSFASKLNVAQNQNPAQNNTVQEELKKEDLVVGKGAEAIDGKTVTVHYTGTLTDGTKFDSSVDRKEPFSFVLGAGEVIQGWDQGVLGMKIGEKRRLTVPSSLGYGPGGYPPVIPPNATLIFEVELLSIQ